MNMSHIGTVVDRTGTDPIHASRAVSFADTPTARVPTAHRGRWRTPVHCIAPGMALLVFTVCASQPVQSGSAAAAQSAQSQSEVATSAPAAVAQSSETQNEVATAAPVAVAEASEPHSEAATPVSAPVAQSPKARDEGSALASAIDSANQAEAVNLAAAAGGMPAQGADQLAANLAKARKLGYRIVDKNGETVYCHDSVATGSHLNKRTICLTEKQWETVSTNSARAMERMQNTRNGCPGRAPCGG